MVKVLKKKTCNARIDSGQIKQLKMLTKMYKNKETNKFK